MSRIVRRGRVSAPIMLRAISRLRHGMKRREAGREKASKPLESKRVRIRITMLHIAVSSQLIRERAISYTTL